MKCVVCTFRGELDPFLALFAFDVVRADEIS